MITLPEIILYAAGIVVGIVWFWWLGLVIIVLGVLVHGVFRIVNRVQSGTW